MMRRSTSSRSEGLPLGSFRRDRGTASYPGGYQTAVEPWADGGDL